MNDNRAARIGEPASAQVRCGINPAQRILVVDDDISVRHLTTEVLVYSGYRVDTAEDGAVAWDTLQINSYDLLVTDHNMPKVSGVELLKKVRLARMALPTILVSGAMPREELNRHAWLQIQATLLKPYTVPELLGTVKEVLRATEGAREPIAPPNRQSQPPVVGLRL